MKYYFGKSPALDYTVFSSAGVHNKKTYLVQFGNCFHGSKFRYEDDEITKLRVPRKLIFLRLIGV